LNLNKQVTLSISRSRYSKKEKIKKKMETEAQRPPLMSPPAFKYISRLLSSLAVIHSIASYTHHFLKDKAKIASGFQNEKRNRGEIDE
jgi:hypothetical protein